MADEDLRHSIIAAACRLEPALDFLTIVQAGKAGAPDDAVLDFAQADQRLVVSHDVSSMIAAAEDRIAGGKGMGGLFMAPKKKSRRLVAESLVFIWAASEAEEWRDKIVFLPL
ncbi:MAG: DUF5615 family PIN-like protein [Pirellulales bacterium]